MNRFRSRALTALLTSAALSTLGLGSVAASDDPPSLDLTCATVAESLTVVCSLESSTVIPDNDLVVVHYQGSEGESISVAVATSGDSDFRSSFSCSADVYCYSFSFESIGELPAGVQILGTDLASTVPPQQDTSQIPTTTTTTTLPQPDNSLGFPCPDQPRLTCADRPTTNVVTLTATGTSVVIHDSNDDSTTVRDVPRYPSSLEDLEQIDDLEEDVSDKSGGDDGSGAGAPMIVVNYPSNPTDPDVFRRYAQAEAAAYAAGRPYMVCWPSEIIGSDGKSYPSSEGCSVIIP